MATSSDRPRVLLLEDDEDIRDLLSRLLESYGCDAALASTREEVEAFLQAGPVQLALLDIMLPGVDGRQVAADLRRRGHTFPIYYVTGMHAMVTPEDRQVVDGVLHKPFTVSELRKLLDSTVAEGPEDEPDGEEEPCPRELELMTAVATHQEALRRQEEHLREITETVVAAGSEGEAREALRGLVFQQQENLRHIQSLLREVSQLLRQR
jgi:CheY-like chemotaxis protein